MRIILLFIGLFFFYFPTLFTQSADIKEAENQAIRTLISQYTQAREKKDTSLLKSILTPDVDQLVSSGTWRRGIRVALEGMLRSSNNNPGKRTITVEHIRFLTPESAIADARYEIQNPDGTARKMWSTFIVSKKENKWRITAIRNMLPAKRGN